MGSGGAGERGVPRCGKGQEKELALPLTSVVRLRAR